MIMEGVQQGKLIWFCIAYDLDSKKQIEYHEFLDGEKACDFIDEMEERYAGNKRIEIVQLGGRDIEHAKVTHEKYFDERTDFEEILRYPPYPFPELGEKYQPEYREQELYEQAQVARAEADQAKALGLDDDQANELEERAHALELKAEQAFVIAYGRPEWTQRSEKGKAKLAKGQRLRAERAKVEAAQAQQPSAAVATSNV